MKLCGRIGKTRSTSSTLLYSFSVHSTGYLAQKVLKIAGFPTKCPQAFPRSVPVLYMSNIHLKKGGKFKLKMRLNFAKSDF